VADDTALDPREHLTAERDRLRSQLDELERGSDASLEFDGGFADSGAVAAEQSEVRALASSLRDQLDEVEGALAAIDAGTYGLCEVCGAPIAAARLEIMPHTQRCIDHA